MVISPAATAANMARSPGGGFQALGADRCQDRGDRAPALDAFRQRLVQTYCHQHRPVSRWDPANNAGPWSARPGSAPGEPGAELPGQDITAVNATV
jgi:hypothetical protein